jgi:hypothetical protein
MPHSFRRLSGPVPAGNVTLRTSRADIRRARAVRALRTSRHAPTRSAPRPKSRRRQDSHRARGVNGRPISDLRLTWNADRVGRTSRFGRRRESRRQRITFLSIRRPDVRAVYPHPAVVMKPLPNPRWRSMPQPGARIASGEPFLVSGWALDRTPAAGQQRERVQVRVSVRSGPDRRRPEPGRRRARPRPPRRGAGLAASFDRRILLSAPGRRRAVSHVVYAGDGPPDSTIRWWPSPPALRRRSSR